MEDIQQSKERIFSRRFSSDSSPSRLRRLSNIKQQNKKILETDNKISSDINTISPDTAYNIYNNNNNDNDNDNKNEIGPDSRIEQPLPPPPPPPSPEDHILINDAINASKKIYTPNENTKKIHEHREILRRDARKTVNLNEAYNNWMFDGDNIIDNITNTKNTNDNTLTRTTSTVARLQRQTINSYFNQQILTDVEHPIKKLRESRHTLSTSQIMDKWKNFNEHFQVIKEDKRRRRSLFNNNPILPIDEEKVAANDCNGDEKSKNGGKTHEEMVEEMWNSISEKLKNDDEKNNDDGIDIDNPNENSHSSRDRSCRRRRSLFSPKSAMMGQQSLLTPKTNQTMNRIVANLNRRHTLVPYSTNNNGNGDIVPQSPLKNHIKKKKKLFFVKYDK